jgi:hypothetical protein
LHEPFVHRPGELSKKSLKFDLQPSAIGVSFRPFVHGAARAGRAEGSFPSISVQGRTSHLERTGRRRKVADRIAASHRFQEEMMRMTQGWTRLRTAVIALGLFAWTTTGAKADTISNLLEYSTAGSVDTSVGVTGANVVSYIPITNAQIDASSNIPLGSFQVAPLLAGQSTTYNNTPFSITMVPASYNNTPLTDTTPVTVTGTLNGTITGKYQSSVNVAFNPISNGAFQLAGASGTLQMAQNDQKLLVPASAGGITTLEGTIKTSGSSNPEAPVPEPSTIALFLSTVGGLGLRKYVLARRHRSIA